MRAKRPARGGVEELVFRAAAPFGDDHGRKLEGVGGGDEVAGEYPTNRVKGERLKVVNRDIGGKERVPLAERRPLIIKVDNSGLVTEAPADEGHY